MPAQDKHVYHAFRLHLLDAKRREIPFLFTYALWFKKWVDSGHWHERGPYKGQYCMARYGDSGPYSFDNTKICPVEENLSEQKFTEETRRRMSTAAKARGISENCKRASIKANQGENNHCAKLTEEIVQYMRKVYVKHSRQFGCGALAKRFNVSMTVVNGVIHRKGWKHLI